MSAGARPLLWVFSVLFPDNQKLGFYPTPPHATPSSLADSSLSFLPVSGPLCILPGCRHSQTFGLLLSPRRSLPWLDCPPPVRVLAFQQCRLGQLRCSLGLTPPPPPLFFPSPLSFCDALLFSESQWPRDESFGDASRGVERPHPDRDDVSAAPASDRRLALGLGFVLPSFHLLPSASAQPQLFGHGMSQWGWGGCAPRRGLWAEVIKEKSGGGDRISQTGRKLGASGVHTGIRFADLEFRGHSFTSIFSGSATPPPPPPTPFRACPSSVTGSPQLLLAQAPFLPPSYPCLILNSLPASERQTDRRTD